MARQTLRRPLTQGGSPVREIRSPGSVRGAARKGRPYRDESESSESESSESESSESESSESESVLDGCNLQGELPAAGSIGNA
jgi:hypothetical protein